MTDGGTAPITPEGRAPFTSEGEPTGHFLALLILGQKRGYLTPDDLIGVMESVELTPSIIDSSIARVRAAGIEWRDDTDLVDDSDLDDDADLDVAGFDEEADFDEDVAGFEELTTFEEAGAPDQAAGGTEEAGTGGDALVASDGLPAAGEAPGEDHGGNGVVAPALETLRPELTPEDIEYLHKGYAGLLSLMERIPTYWAWAAEPPHVFRADE